MFKFNFSDKNDEDNTPSKDASDDLEWLPAEYLTLNGEYKIDEYSLHTYNCGQFSIRYHDVNSAIHRASSTTKCIAIAEQNQSDLLPSKYEGGLKIWECTYDLAEYLTKELGMSSLSGSSFLDLGCGAGILGILALKLGADVTFQDYNKEVLETTTIPNVLVNLSPEDRHILLNNQLCKFYSGDWGSFEECHQVNASKTDCLFDFILTSETIYNPVNHKKLLSLFSKCLKKSGSVYLAAKTHYFGVGGGTRQFEDMVDSDGEMTTSVCWKSEGVERYFDWVINGPLGRYGLVSVSTGVFAGNKIIIVHGRKYRHDGFISLGKLLVVYSRALEILRCANGSFPPLCDVIFPPKRANQIHDDVTFPVGAPIKVSDAHDQSKENIHWRVSEYQGLYIPDTAI